ncbi:ABC transporter ATP-binding protein [Ruminococcus sp.]|uniref:ABC transporter ATP-binding protein n=1 Tax=Ruminococcus sp. TaxID=41978 RepID=UPI002B709F9D|nr:ABC transporter ATP-binding protein [Ruminococcus sp.]HNZ98106.1 ABC transporter ATP-binding protein [Ruminococcus sp.]HOH87351.1 ABC transporter ATP-binding protein [Ruminococcus sp.]
MNALEIKDLTKEYKGFKLDNLSLTLPTGCIMGLIGENGAGKSTTINSILGLKKYDHGTIKVLGQDMSAELKKDIGVVLDEVGIPQALNIKNVRSVMKNIYSNWDDKAFGYYVKKFSLPDNKKFSDFSKGMKMKLAIAIALSHNAKLLILDEPTSGLDPLVRDEIIDILNDFTRDEGHSILISSHIVSDLEKLCDYIAFLHKGKLMLCEEKDVLLERYRFINATEEQLSELDPDAIKGKKIGKFSTEAIVDQELIPASFRTAPITIEDLFVFMAKEEN